MGKDDKEKGFHENRFRYIFELTNKEEKVKEGQEGQYTITPNDESVKDEPVITGTYLYNYDRKKQRDVLILRNEKKEIIYQLEKKNHDETCDFL